MLLYEQRTVMILNSMVLAETFYMMCIILSGDLL